MLEWKSDKREMVMAGIKDNPTVSVIIPTYNRAHLIGRAIQSVLNQTYQDFEIIVVDDASTDNAEEIVNSFDDKRIRYIRLKENSGTSAAPRNTAIRIARGKYIAFLDSDDEWLPEKLEKQIRLFETVFSKVGIIYTDMWRINKNEKKKYWHSSRIMPEDGIIYEEALNYRVEFIGTATLAIKKECFGKAGLFDEKLPMYIDTELLMRMSKYYCFCHIEEPLVNYFVTPNSTSSGQIATIKARKLIIEKHFDDIKKNKYTLAEHYFHLGSDLCLQRDFKTGREYMLKAIRAYPLNIKYFVAVLISLFGFRIYNGILKIRFYCANW